MRSEVQYCGRFTLSLRKLDKPPLNNDYSAAIAGDRSKAISAKLSSTRVFCGRPGFSSQCLSELRRHGDSKHPIFLLTRCSQCDATGGLHADSRRCLVTLTSHCYSRALRLYRKAQRISSDVC